MQLIARCARIANREKDMEAYFPSPSVKLVKDTVNGRMIQEKFLIIHSVKNKTVKLFTLQSMSSIFSIRTE